LHKGNAKEAHQKALETLILEIIMATGLHLRLDNLEALAKTINDRLTKVETEVTSAGGDATLTQQVQSLRTDLSSLQGDVGSENGTAAPADDAQAKSP
jgi:hypothetical protein